MEVPPARGADGQAAVRPPPGQGALPAPALAAQAGAALSSLARAADRDPACAHGAPPARAVRRLVRVACVRALARPAPWPLEGPEAGDQRLKDAARGALGRGAQHRARETLPVHDTRALAARCAALRRMRPACRAPLWAGAKALSPRARRHARVSAAPTRSPRAWGRRVHTPARCHARRRRPQGTPRPQPLSWGTIAHGRPLVRTQLRPGTAARAGTRGRPPFGWGGAGGSSGAMLSHRASVPTGLLLPREQAARPVPRC